jgi:hypothetical protein
LQGRGQGKAAGKARPRARQGRGQGKAAGKKEIPLSPIAIEIVRRIDTLFEIERSVNGKSAEERLAARGTLSRPLVEDLHAYMRAQLARLARGHDLVKAINYMLKRWAAFTLFLDDGRVCLSNNAAERGLRGIVLEENRGCSAGPIAVVDAPRLCTVSLSRRR